MGSNGGARPLRGSAPCCTGSADMRTSMAATAGHSVTWRIPDDLLGAFCRVNHVALEPTGRGLLDGLAFAVKDVFHIAGHHTGFGHPGIHLRRDTLLSIAYSEELISSTISATLQSTDR